MFIEPCSLIKTIKAHITEGVMKMDSVITNTNNLASSVYIIKIIKILSGLYLSVSPFCFPMLHLSCSQNDNKFSHFLIKFYIHYYPVVETFTWSIFLF